MEPTDFPATERAAELEALRLGCGALEASTQQVAELIARGKLDPAHPWPAALLWRRVRDLRSGDRVVADDVLRPLLDLPFAAEVVRAAASKDPTGGLSLLADALAKIQYEDEFSVLVRRGLMSEIEAAQRRRQIEFDLVAGRCQWPVVSRRRLQWRRRLLAEMEHLEGGGKRWPEGRGRRPRSEGKRGQVRRADLCARFEALTPERQASMIGSRRVEARQFVRQHAARHGMSLATAERDWLAVRRQLHARGLLGVSHLGAKQEQLERRLSS
jgi:hypothetical protein